MSAFVRSPSGLSGNASAARTPSSSPSSAEAVVVRSPEELYRDPRNLFVAGFIGSPAMNLVPAPTVDGVGGSDRIAGFRSEHLDLANRRPDGIRFDAGAEVVEYFGEEPLVHMTRKEASLQAKLPVEADVKPGQHLASSCRATSCCCSTPKPSIP
jgi:ABC-type sugar transport system ATPase subunit